jgi:hypothetical protein
MSNSWEKGMRTWTKMIDEASEDSPSVRPRFMDFKIYADADHHQAGSAANLLPYGPAGVATAGDWDYSSIHVPDSSSGVTPQGIIELDILATGANYPGASAATGNDAVSLIEGYAASRALPDVLDPNTPDDARAIDGPTPQNWLQAIFNEGLIQDSEIVRDLQTQNEISPYPFENDGVNLDTMYPGGANQLSGLAIHDSVSYSATSVGGKAYGKGGNFPCGLIKISHLVDLSSIAHNLVIQLDLVPGTHRGYMCEPMTEM